MSGLLDELSFGMGWNFKDTEEEPDFVAKLEAAAETQGPNYSTAIYFQAEGTAGSSSSSSTSLTTPKL
jgi:hypothetical protein